MFGGTRKLSTASRIVSVIFKYTVSIVIKFLKIFINGTIAIVSYFKRIERCPPIKNDLLYISATELAKKIRTGQITSREVVSAYIARTKEVNTVINAVIEERYNDALNDADRVDKLISSKAYTEEELETKFPLLGLPVTVKSSIAVKGMLFVGGRYFPDLENHRAKEDADTVKQIKDAGGIILLISSCPELCKNFECFNKIIGTTKNPYDTRRTCGGSSGGEAALLSTGASLIGLGSDMAGSCRVPAAFCGVFGHKPSARSVSVEGHYPDSADRENWTNNFVLGPMVRYAQDFPLLMRVLSKAEKGKTLNLTQQVDLKNVKLFYRFNNGDSVLTGSVDQDISHRIGDIAEHFKTLGCYTEEPHIKMLKHSTGIAFAKLLTMNDVDDVFDRKSKCVYTEIAKKLFNCSEHAFFSLFYIAGKRTFDRHLSRTQLDACDKSYNILKASFCDILKDDGVFIYPTSIGPAFYHGQSLGNFFDSSYTAIFNVLGFPSTNCPVGFTSEGLPIGIQVVANTNCDRLTFAVAQEIQKLFGGWKPPRFTQSN